MAEMLPLQPAEAFHRELAALGELFCPLHEALAVASLWLIRSGAPAVEQDWDDCACVPACAPAVPGSWAPDGAFQRDERDAALFAGRSWLQSACCTTPVAMAGGGCVAAVPFCHS